MVEVTVPADAAVGAKDAMVVSARTDSDGGTRAFVRIETSAR
jgi:hypothetical protein